MVLRILFRLCPNDVSKWMWFELMREQRHAFQLVCTTMCVNGLKSQWQAMHDTFATRGNMFGRRLRRGESFLPSDKKLRCKMEMRI